MKSILSGGSSENNVCQKTSELCEHFYQTPNIWITSETQDYSPVFLVSSHVSRKTFFLMALNNRMVSGCWSHVMLQKPRPLLDFSKTQILSPQDPGPAAVPQMGNPLWLEQDRSTQAEELHEAWYLPPTSQAEGHRTDLPRAWLEGRYHRWQLKEQSYK